jgi:hypothetical protein
MNDAAEPFVPRDRLLLVSTAKTIGKTKSIYDAARFAWPLSVDRARNVELVLACVEGIVNGVLCLDFGWMPPRRTSPILSQPTEAFDGDLRVWKQTK